MKQLANRWLMGLATLALGLSFIVTYAQEPVVLLTLEARAILPAATFAEGPASGAAIDPAGANGVTVPFESHPVQGISAVLPAETEGHWLVLSDNGYGAKGNSADYNLRWYEVAVDFAAGSVEVVGFTQLSDPNTLVPFPIVNQETEDRVLTGADFDIESFRRLPDGSFYVGEEFGPYLLHFSAEGVLLAAPIPTPYPAELGEFARGLDFVQSPQHPDFVGLADNDARSAAANLPGSRGFEGMAISPDGATLYSMLEGPLVDDTNRNRLLIQAFDVASAAYGEDYWYYPMTLPGNAIGEMTAINANQFIVIERDGGQGADAYFKRIFLVDFTNLGEDGHTLNKTLIADLLAIADSNGLTQPESGAVGLGPVFKFPFVTIESVWPVDADTLLVINDNNFPFSTGRRPGVPDDNEFILITLPQALNLGG
jgi:glycerophosphoryl diester phosphodiesterase